VNDTLLPPGAPAETHDLAQALETLQRQFQLLLIILAVLIFVFDCYMARQWRQFGREVAILEPQVTAFNQGTLPVARNFVAQLTEYAKTHPDFQTILAKYPLQAPSNAAPATAQPAKAAIPAPAKAQPARPPAPAPAPKK